jgi:hypothetical protein
MEIQYDRAGFHFPRAAEAAEKQDAGRSIYRFRIGDSP